MNNYLLPFTYHLLIYIVTVSLTENTKKNREHLTTAIINRPNADKNKHENNTNSLQRSVRILLICSRGAANLCRPTHVNFIPDIASSNYFREF